ncbi:MAG: MATE family efflux transporter [Lachnospiraceae bacterium]|jgi:putative MATE family efflux protein|nr:MATE family efflux transporter [Lachnospiraceae bacterium]MCI1328310.1 MATE family efflux transporter [Lachnospiraceae bacterium]
MEQENRMGTDRISSVLIKMGIPVILSMVLQAMYNIVDSMFVARMPDRPDIEHAGELAVNALTLSFPIQMLMIAFGIGTGVGMGAMLSRLLGSGEKEKASRTAGNGIFLAIVIYLVFLVFAFVGIRPYLLSQSRDETVLGMAQSYLFICTALGLFSLLFAIYEKMLQSTGKTIYSTVAQICGALTNIVLDPIMIYGLFGLPAMGVDGAAYATVIGQFVSFLIAFILQVTKNKEIPSGFRYLRPDRKLIGGIYSIGVSAIIMQALMSFMTYGVNIIFGAVSANAVTAYGIFYKIQQFVYFAGFGLRDSITPLISYNYGKGSYTRVKEGMKWGIIDTTTVMVIGIVILQFFAHPLARFFGLTAETERLCVLAMRIISTGFIFAGINIASQGIFQALLSGNSSLIVSFLRLLVIPLPLAYAFTRLSNAADVMWWAFPIGEAVACVAAVFLMRRIYRLRVVPMKEWGSPNRSV